MIIVIIAFGVLIFIHELAHFLTAKKMGVKVEIFSLGFGPKIFFWRKRDTEYRISILPLGGYVKLAGNDLKEERKGTKEEFLSQPPGKRSLILLAGPLGNYFFGFLIFLYLFLFGFPTLGTKIGKILEGYPAEESGLKVGDEILSIDSQSVSTWEELTEIIHPKFNEIIEVQVKRGKDIFNLKIRTVEKEIIDFLGKERKIGLIGITPDPENVFKKRYHLFPAIIKSLNNVLQITRVTFIVLVNIIRGNLSFKEHISGPVRLFYLSSQAVKIGFLYFLNLMAIISVSLAIFNLLPIPVLDGGHILFTLIEKVRRKPISVKIQESLTQIGWFLLLILVLYVTCLDIRRFFAK